MVSSASARPCVAGCEPTVGSGSGEVVSTGGSVAGASVKLSPNVGMGEVARVGGSITVTPVATFETGAAFFTSLTELYVEYTAIQIAIRQMVSAV